MRGAEGQAGAVHLKVQGPHRFYVPGQGDRGGRARRQARHSHTKVRSYLLTKILVTAFLRVTPSFIQSFVFSCLKLILEYFYNRAKMDESYKIK